MGWTLPSTGMWRGEVFAISDCLVCFAITHVHGSSVTNLYSIMLFQYGSSVTNMYSIMLFQYGSSVTNMYSIILFQYGSSVTNMYSIILFQYGSSVAPVFRSRFLLRFWHWQWRYIRKQGTVEDEKTWHDYEGTRPSRGRLLWLLRTIHTSKISEIINIHCWHFFDIARQVTWLPTSCTCVWKDSARSYCAAGLWKIILVYFIFQGHQISKKQIY